MKLRDYQEYLSDRAVELLQFYVIAYLSMEVRTGKTLTALAAADKFNATHVLFVTKKKAIQSIQDDYEALSPKYTISVINYESLHNYRGRPDLIVLDEAHCISQFPTPAERTRLIKEIAGALPILYLSGTPTPESYSQLYHQFWVSHWSPFKEYKNFYAWAKEYVNIKKRYFYNREVMDYTDAKKDLIDKATSHLFLSYTQGEAGFKQEVKEEVIYLRMQPGTYYLADKMLRDRVHIGKAGEEIVADTEVKLQQKLHQIYSGTVKAEDGRAIVFDRSKANFIKEHFKGKKIAIFYKFVAEADMLIREFGSHNLTQSPEEFNKRSDLVFYSQIQSGREGINLSTADALVMLNIDFSSVSYQQARARMQAKDRSKEAMLYWIFAENGIEKNIYDRVINKQDYTLSYFRKDFNIKKLKTA